MKHGIARGLAIALIAVFTTATFTASAPPASAWVSGKLFDPAFIISDQQFYDEDAMSVSQIQSFLNAKVPTCHPELSSGPNDPIVCLKDFKQTTISRAADAYCPNAYVGANNESAATIIYKVAQACGISPKVILVTLQKEVGLVTHSWPSEWRYDRAMGYGCPDTAPCNTEYYGFQNQVWRAAHQFQVYRILPGRYGHLAGVANNVRFHPNTACGTSSVVIKNQATAGLYNYTPYQPNSAALAALPGTGNSCSSYGNRNFWMYYWEWFGDPQAIGALVNVTADQRIAGANRYATAAALSAGFEADAAVVYVASGENYPDALAVAPIAASDGAALLLVRRNSIPSEIAAELTRLNPMRIVVIGGAGAINEAVFGKLKGYAGEGGITRLGGIDRYETARTTVREHWTDGSASLVYVASGQNFPDALSAAAAAGTQDAPVITLNGSEAHLDAATAALIKSLGATEIIVAGGAAVVSDGIVNDLAAISGVTTVRRLFGTDRYATSAAINTDAFSSASRVYLASGNDFPDALAGTVRAAADNAPLYIVPGSCIPRVIADSINVFGPIEVTLIGGAAVLPLNLATAPICR